MLEELKNLNKVVGLKQVAKAINEEGVKALYIAEDADPKVVEKIKLAAKQKNIDTIYVESMKKLGKACGIDVGAATAATLK